VSVSWPPLEHIFFRFGGNSHDRMKRRWPSRRWREESGEAKTLQWTPHFVCASASVCVMPGWSGASSQPLLSIQVSSIKKVKDSSKGKPQDSMVINMEWGSFISHLLPMTADDHASDSTGANPGKCFFEKLISGMFMGEAVSEFLPSQPGHSN